MNLNKLYKNTAKLLMLSLTATLMVACQPDELGAGNGLVENRVLDAEFTITQVTDVNNNTFLVSADNENFITSHWDFEDGLGYNFEGLQKELFLPDAGTYNIHHKVTGVGGANSIVTKSLKVETSDPLAGNIVRGGRLDTPEDIAEWTVLNISASGTEWTFADGKATVQGGGWNQKGIYQAIDVIEGQEYKIDMQISSTSGVDNTWFEVFAAPVQPQDGSDYSAGGAIAKFSTWGGCAIEPFSGLLSVIGCDFPGEQGKYIAEATETIYLVIKCGGEDLKDGVSIDNVEMRAQH